MNNFKKAILFIGIAVVVLVCALVAVALWALHRKQENYNKIAPAAARRHVPKEEQKPIHENGTNNSEVDTGNNGSGLNGLDIHKPLPDSGGDKGRDSEV